MMTAMEMEREFETMVENSKNCIDQFSEEHSRYVAAAFGNSLSFNAESDISFYFAITFYVASISKLYYCFIVSFLHDSDGDDTCFYESFDAEPVQLAVIPYELAEVKKFLLSMEKKYGCQMSLYGNDVHNINDLLEHYENPEYYRLFDDKDIGGFVIDFK